MLKSKKTAKKNTSAIQNKSLKGAKAKISKAKSKPVVKPAVKQTRAGEADKSKLQKELWNTAHLFGVRNKDIEVKPNAVVRPNRLYKCTYGIMPAAAKVVGVKLEEVSFKSNCKVKFLNDHKGKTFSAMRLEGQTTGFVTVEVDGVFVRGEFSNGRSNQNKNYLIEIVGGKSNAKARSGKTLRNTRNKK